MSISELGITKDNLALVGGGLQRLRPHIDFGMHLAVETVALDEVVV